MPIYKVIEYSRIYSQTSEGLWQYYRDELALNNGAIIDFSADDDSSILFKFKEKITGKTGNNGTKDVKTMVPIKCLSNYWRRIEMPLINCEISVMLNWYEECILVAGTAANQLSTFTTFDTKLYLPVVTLSPQDKQLLKQLESGFKRTMDRNKYQSIKTNQAQNKYLDFSIDPSFQGVNRLFVLSFEDRRGRESYKRYHLPTF